MLTPDHKLSRLTITLARLKAGYNSVIIFFVSLKKINRNNLQ